MRRTAALGRVLVCVAMSTSSCTSLGGSTTVLSGYEAGLTERQSNRCSRVSIPNIRSTSRANICLAGPCAVARVRTYVRGGIDGGHDRQTTRAVSYTHL